MQGPKNLGLNRMYPKEQNVIIDDLICAICSDIVYNPRECDKYLIQKSLSVTYIFFFLGAEIFFVEFVWMIGLSIKINVRIDAKLLYSRNRIEYTRNNYQ